MGRSKFPKYINVTLVSVEIPESLRHLNWYKVNPTVKLPFKRVSRENHYVVKVTCSEELDQVLINRWIKIDLDSPCIKPKHVHDDEALLLV